MNISTHFPSRWAIGWTMLLILLGTSMANAQTTYYSQGNINFNAFGGSTWNTAAGGGGTDAPVGHETAGNNSYIILNGHTVTISSAISVSQITVGDGVTATNGTLTIGAGAGGYTVAIADDFSVRTGSTVNTSNTGTDTHTVTINGDITIGGTVTFANSNTVDLTMGGAAASIFSGTGAITLDNLTINGGVARVISTSTTPTISGNLTVDGAGTEVSISNSLNIAGNYTITNGAVWNSVAGTMIFNGATAQTLSLTGGTTTFFGLTFDNGGDTNVKTISGDLVVNGTTRITNDGFVTSTNQNHQLEDLRLDASDGATVAANFSGGSITFRGFNGTNADIYGQAGDLTFQVGSNNCNIIIAYNTWIQAGDNVRVAGNIDIQAGYLVLNGSTPVGETYTVNSSLKPVGGVARSFTMATNTNFYIRGANNFPLYQTADVDGYFNFTFGADSWVRYDTESHQTVRGNETGYPTVTYSNLLLSQTLEPSEGGYTQKVKTLNAGAILDVNGTLNLSNGIEFVINGTDTHTFAGSITTDDAPEFLATSATIKLDAPDVNQVMQGNGVTYSFGNFIIEQTAPTAVRTKTIQANIEIADGGGVQIINTGGNEANYLQVNLDTYSFLATDDGSDANDTFQLGQYCRLFTESSNFLINYEDVGDVLTFHPESIVRFDLDNDNQGIPNIGTNYYGTIEITGTGNKGPMGTTLNVAGDFRWIGGGTPVLTVGQTHPSYNNANITITVLGDWDMSQTVTATGTNGANNNSTIIFAGADQYISSSDLHNITFSGTGTKTVNGNLNIEGNLVIENGVTVGFSDNFIQIDENWTVNGTGKFTQTTGTTRFEGYTGITTQTITIADPTQSYFGNVIIDKEITLVLGSNVVISRSFDTDDTTTDTNELGGNLDMTGRTLSIGNDFTWRRGSVLTKDATSKFIFNGDTDQSINYSDDIDEDNFGDGTGATTTGDIDNDNDDVFPSIEFDGVGRKTFTSRATSMWWLIDGDVTIGNSSSVDGNNRNIIVSGNWTNTGSFVQNGSTVVFTHITADANLNQTISTSTFNTVIFGSATGFLTTTGGQNYMNGTTFFVGTHETGTKTLTGAISASEDIIIAGDGTEQTTLDVSASNYAISVDDDWFNNGIFVARNGTVNFNGAGTQTVTSTNSTAANKAFYNIVVTKTANTVFEFSNTSMVSNRVDILGSLTNNIGTIELNADGNSATPNTIYIGGSLSNADIITFNDTYGTDAAFEGTPYTPALIFNGTSGTHTINMGIADLDQTRNVFGATYINASGATYQMAANSVFQSDYDCRLFIVAGTLDLNGFSMTTNIGGVEQSGGTFQIDEGSSLVLNSAADVSANDATKDGAFNAAPAFYKSGGSLEIVGTATNNASITSEATGTGAGTLGFEFVQEGGTTTMSYFTISNSDTYGMDFSGGTLVDLNNGTFSGGGANAYMAFRNVDIGTGGAGINASNIVFNSGPTNNVHKSTSATDGVNGTLTFVIAGGTLAGATAENDFPDNGASDGSFIWTFPEGWHWVGNTSTDWHTGSNWQKDGSVTDDGNDGVPDADDFVYIGNSVAIGTNAPSILNSNATVTRLTIGTLSSPRNNLTLANNRNLTILGNMTNAGTLTTTNSTNTITVHGSWSNDASTSSFVETQSTVIFKGSTGNYNISTRETSSLTLSSATINASVDAFYNLTINSRNGADTEDGDAVYTMGSAIRVTNEFEVLGGTFDASTGFPFEFAGTEIRVDDGGVLNAGLGTFYINATSGTQTMYGGTYFNVVFRNAGTKSIGSNILVEGDLTLDNTAGSTTGTLSCNDKIIFVGDEWTNNVGTSAFDEGTGTVTFYQQDGTQVITGDTEFYKLVFQNVGTKQVALGTDLTINNSLNMISDENNLLEILGDGVTDATITAGTGTNELNMTGGTIRVFGTNNFPVGFEAYNLSAGTVDYRGDRTQTIVGNLSYFNLTIQNNNSTASNATRTKTLADDIIVKGDFTLDNSTANTGAVTFDVNGKTITLTGAFAVGNSTGDINTPDNTVTWNNGTLIHVGGGFTLDIDVPTFNNLTLQGSGAKTMTRATNITGNLFIDQSVTLAMAANSMTATGGVQTFTMEESSALTTSIPATAGVAFPTGFDTYAMDEFSTVTLNASLDQKIFSGAQYGALTLSTVGNAHLDGNLVVNGNFTSSSNTVLNDGDYDDAGVTRYNMELNGATVQINNYPNPQTTVTFSRTGDQTITDNTTASGDAFILNNVVFSNSGTKTLTSNNATDYYDVRGTLTVNSPAIVTTTRSFRYSGTAFVNNGQFYSTNATYPMLFNRTTDNQDITPGATHGFESIQFTGDATKTILGTDGFNIENGTFTLIEGGIVDFGTATHTLACTSFNVDDALWNTDNANLIFDREALTGIRSGNQTIPILVANHVTFANDGTKTLTDIIDVNDLTIEESVTLDVSASGPFDVIVRGNWNNEGGTFTPRTGTVYFESSDTNAKTITPASSTFYNLSFNQNLTDSRTYTLAADLTVTEDLTIGDGATFDVNSQLLTLGNNDNDDPAPETHTVEVGGTLRVGGGGTIQIDCSDDDDDTAIFAGDLNVNGTLEIVGTVSQVANFTRSAGGGRIDIDINSGATIKAQYYHIQYLVDEGLQVFAGATVDATNNFSNGTWSNMNTNASQRWYLDLQTDNIATPTIDAVTFNFGGTPNTTNHRNVRRNPALTVAVTFTNTGGLLGNPGSYYEFENGTSPAPTGTAHNTGILLWDTPTIAIWQGDVSTDWFNADNWLNNDVPSTWTGTGTVNSTLPNAQIGTGNPYPCVIAGASVNVSGNITITSGILKLEDANADLDIDGDFVVGQSAGSALLVADAGATITVGQNWSTGGTTVFEHGNGTVIFDAPSGNTATVTPGTQAFYNLTFSEGGLYNYAGTNLYVDGNFTIEENCSVTPSNTDYNIYIKGNATQTGAASFNTTIDGEIIFNGAAQTVTDIDMDEVTVQGTDTKDFVGNILINDNLIIKNGATLRGTGTLDMDGNVTIEAGGIFEGVNGSTYTFAGTDWIAGAGSYTGQGTVNFNRLGNTQYIRQHTTGAANAAEFHNLTFSGSTSRIELGRIVTTTQYDGNVKMTGDLTVTNSINEFWTWSYLIENENAPSGTFTLEADEVVDVRGANNYPKGFATYNVNATSFSRYFGTGAQTIRGKVNDGDPDIVYGNLILEFASTKTLEGAIDVNGYLEVREATLDVSTSNYSINIAGNWDNQQDGENGSFLCRQGTVTFDGSGNTQNIFIGQSGTQDFYNIIVNKSSGTASLNSNNVNITGNLTATSGTFNINNLRATISGNMNANNSGQFGSGNGVTALYKLIGSAPSHTIRTNGSTIAGSMEIDASGRTYILEDNLTVNNDFTLTAGIFEVNGHTANLCDGADNLTIYGDFRVSTTSRPGGALALGPNTQVVVNPGGTFRAVGLVSDIARVSRRSGTTGRYNFNVVGEMGNAGNIHAKYALFEYMGQDGIFLNQYSLIDETNNFSDVTFNNGIAGGKFLRIENTQDLTQADGKQILNVSFPANPGGGAFNVFKTTQSTGTIEFEDFSGNFSGELYDQDPNNLINWILPDVIYWTGAVSSDWFVAGNWYNASTLTNEVPTIDDEVIIPTFGLPFTLGSETFTVINEPIIGSPYTNHLTQQAQAKNITVQTNANIVLNTADGDKGIDDASNDTDLVISNDINYEASSEVESKGALDIMSVGGAWNKVTGSLFTAGTSRVILNFQGGIRSLDNGSDDFYDLDISATGTVQLANTLFISNDFTVTTGTFTQNSFDMTVQGDFSNSSTFTPTTATVLLLPNNGTTRTINIGSSNFYNLSIGRNSPASSSPEYDLTSDLRVTHNLDINKGTGNIILDLNGNDIYQGDNDGVEDDTNIYGYVTVEGGETLYLTGDANWEVQSGGRLRFWGTDTNVRATATRQSGSTGGYNLTVLSGATFSARYYTFDYLEGNRDSDNRKAGLWIKSGANTPTSEDDGFTTDGDFTSEQNPPRNDTDTNPYPTILNYGTFSNGQGYRYLTIDNNFAGAEDYIARDVAFSTGPTRNVKRLSTATNNINFRNYSGLLSGALLEEDDFSALTGKVRWSSQYIIYIWTGATSTAWEDATNWKLEDSTVPPDYPYDQSFVIIPPKNNQRDITNTLVSPQRDPIWPSGLVRNPDPYTIANLVLQPDGAVNTGGKLFVQNGVDITVSQNIEIGGNAELNIAGNGGISLGNSWINSGVFTPNQTTVTLISDDDEQFGGGVKFYNLVINSSNVAGAVFTSTSTLEVENDFTITNGTYEVTDDAHDITIGGDFAVATDGNFVAITDSKVTFNGTSSQAINITDPTNDKFYNVDFDTDGTITLNSDIVVDGELTIIAGATLSQGANDIELKGNWTNYGVFTAGTGTVVFNGTEPQNIAGTNNQVFSNLEVDNAGATSVDLFILRNTFVTTNLNFVTGIVETGESNYLQFNDGATHTGFSSSNYVIGPVRKAGNDDFIFPVGDLTRSAGIAISDLTDVSNIFKGEYATGANANATDDQGSDFVTDCSNCEAGLNRVSLNESWDLERVSGTEYPRIGLYFPSSTFSQISDFANLVVAHYNSGTSTWEMLGNGAGSLGAGYIEAATLPTSLSPITFGNLTNGNNPLPVTLVSFTGKPVEETVVLDWVTASEFNNDYFEVQRSEDGLTFETLGKVDGSGTSNVRKDYQFTDVEPIIGVNYYRLKQVDTNGVFEYSKVIAVSFSQDDLGGSQIVVYPNPARNQDKVNVELKGFAPEREVSIQLIDLTGKVLNVSLSKTNKSGALRESVNLPSQLASGVYNLLIQDGDKSYSKRIVIQ